MYPYTKRPEDRIIAWREFRQTITDNSKPTLETIVTFWSGVPVGTRVLEWDRPDNWPTPWEAINDNAFCDDMRAYMTYQTLLLSNIPATLYHIKTFNEELMVVSCNGYVLNFSFNEVVTVSGMLEEFEIDYEYFETPEGFDFKRVA